MDINVLFSQMVILVSLMVVGFVVRRRGILDDIANGYLTKLMLRVTLPATVTASITGAPIDVPRGDVPFLFFIIFLTFVILCVISWIVAKLCRVSQYERGAYVAMGMFSNVNFMSIPLVAAMFGPEGMLFGILYNIVFNLIIFSFGMKLVGGERAKISLKFFFSPVMIAGLFSVTLFMIDVQLPATIHSSLSLLGSATTPIAMLLLGSILGAMKIKEMFQGVNIYIISLVRLVIGPVAVLFFLRLFTTLDPLFVQVVMVMGATPMAISIATFALNYEQHQKLIGKGIFISTLMSIAALPLLLGFLL